MHKQINRAEVKNTWSFTFTPLYTLLILCSAQTQLCVCFTKLTCITHKAFYDDPIAFHCCGFEKTTYSY
jgi:hypothetical protein